MLRTLTPLVPPEALQIVLVLMLSFFVGLEREEHKQHTADYAFGGIRTFPLLGLLGYALALLSGEGGLAWAAGFAVVGGLMMLSYHHKLSASGKPGITTEISGLTTYVVGVLVFAQHYWLASTLAVISVLLLELKQRLEELTRQVDLDQIVTLTKFLLLAVVILPVLPNEPLSPFRINPFRTWLVVVTVSAISYASYLIQRALHGRVGVLLAGVLGGAYSSTVTTVALARRARTDRRPNLFAGAILASSGVMYARLALLVTLFNCDLAALLAPAFGILTVVTVGAGALMARRGVAPAGQPVPAEATRNPLEIPAALLFAGLFVGVTVLSTWIREALGQRGLYVMAAVLGVTDVDPFILSLTQSSQATVPLGSAAIAIVIASAANNAAKGLYALVFADRATGVRSLVALLLLGLLGLAPLLRLPW